MHNKVQALIKYKLSFLFVEILVKFFYRKQNLFFRKQNSFNDGPVAELAYKENWTCENMAGSDKGNNTKIIYFKHQNIWSS